MFSWSNYFTYYYFLHEVFFEKVNDYLIDDQTSINLKEFLLINSQFHYFFKKENKYIQPVHYQSSICLCWMSDSIYSAIKNSDSLSYYHVFGIETKEDLDNFIVSDNIAELIHQDGYRQFTIWWTDQEYLIDSTRHPDILTYYQIDVNPIDHRQTFLLSFYMCELETDWGRPRIHRGQHFSHWIWYANDQELELADQPYLDHYHRLSEEDQPYQYDYGGHDHQSKLERTPNNLNWLDLAPSKSLKIDQSFSFSRNTFQEIQRRIESKLYQDDSSSSNDFSSDWDGHGFYFDITPIFTLILIFLIFFLN